MITIHEPTVDTKYLIASDFLDGHAYLSIEDRPRIFIGNSISSRDDRIKGFSVDGKQIAWESDTQSKYEEIDLDINWRFIK